MNKIIFITLGCKVNHYETECMKTIFSENGYEITDVRKEADVVIINSCTVTSSGDSRTLNALKKIREELPNAVIALTGCYPQANIKEASQIAEADIISGTKERSKLVELVGKCLKERSRTIMLSDYSKDDDFECLQFTSTDSRTRAVVKIQDGCNQFCSYCIIPYARGRCRSKPLNVLRDEVKYMAENGKKEIVLSGINLAFYGQEFNLNLADAVEVCAEIEGIERIRLGSLEPEMMSDELLERLAALPKFCPHFHLSLQSGCSKTLKAMNRRYNAEEYWELMQRIRRALPECSFTTDIMVGFPQETDEDFNESLNFVKKAGFSKIHVFRYSRRKGTVADRMGGQIPENLKSKRWHKMNSVANQSREEYLKSLVGKTVKVLFERENNSDFYHGYAPDYSMIKIPRKNLKKSLRNTIICVTIVESFSDYCLGIISD